MRCRVNKVIAYMAHVGVQLLQLERWYCAAIVKIIHMGRENALYCEILYAGVNSHLMALPLKNLNASATQQHFISLSRVIADNCCHTKFRAYAHVKCILY
jgi:hypothetical protein